MKKLLLLTVFFGCAAAADPAPALPVTFWTDEVTARPMLAHAVARMAEATGRDISMAEGGIPVIFKPEARDPLTGEGLCGVTVARGNGQVLYLEISNGGDRRCMVTEATLLHEMIHALAPGLPHTDQGTLFGPKADKTAWIDEESLGRLCESFECHAFNPERP